MKARPIERYELGTAFGEPSHVIGLGNGRAMAVSRFGRKIAVLEAGTTRECDLARLAREPSQGGADYRRRGAPFRWGRGFGVAYRDVLHLWPTPDDEPITLPMTIPDAEARSERGGLEPLFACAAGEHGAIVALKAGAASVHSAHRLVRIAWDEREARWDARDLYLDARAVEGEDAMPSESDLHPPTLESAAPDGDGGGRIILHSIGPSRNYARYGMAYSVLAWLDAAGATTRVVRIPDGYARITGDRVLLQALRSKSRGLDFTLLSRDGTPLDTLRVTERAMAPVQNHWLTTDFCASELWLSDNDGHVVGLALE